MTTFVDAVRQTIRCNIRPRPPVIRLRHHWAAQEHLVALPLSLSSADGVPKLLLRTSVLRAPQIGLPASVPQNLLHGSKDQQCSRRNSRNATTFSHPITGVLRISIRHLWTKSHDWSVVVLRPFEFCVRGRDLRTTGGVKEEKYRPANSNLTVPHMLTLTCRAAYMKLSERRQSS